MTARARTEPSVVQPFTVQPFTVQPVAAQPVPGERALHRVGALAVVAIMAVAAGAAFRRVFEVEFLVPEIPVAAVLPVVLVGLTRYRRRQLPLVLSVCGWVAAFVVWACYTVAAGAGGGVRGRLELLGSGLLHGPARLLDVTVPAPADPGLLVVPVAITWLAAAIGAEIVVRSRAALTAALPAVLALLAATAAGVPAAGDNLSSAAVVAVGAAVLAAARPPTGIGRLRRRDALASARRGPAAVDLQAGHDVHRDVNRDVNRDVDLDTAAGLAADVDVDADDDADDARIVTLFPVGVPAGEVSAIDGRGDRDSRRSQAPRRRVRRTIGSAVASVVVVALGLLVAVVLPADSSPFDPRERVLVATSDLTGLSPLSALGGWSAHPDTELFTVTVAGASAPSASASDQPSTRLRLAVLDAYDGVGWATTGQFVRASNRLAAAPGPDAVPTGNEVVQTVDLAALGGRLIPASDRPVEVRRLPGADSQAPAGVADEVVVDPDSGTLVAVRALAAGDRYQVVSVPARSLAAAELAGLEAAPDPATGPTLALPERLPPVVRQLAAVAAGRGQTAFARAALLEDYLSANFAFDPRAPAGQSLAHVEHFVSQTRRAGSDLFATTFALAGRVLGLPTRVAVGFVVEASNDRAQPVVARDALAWPEVHFAGVGWVPFFPTPAAANGGPTGGGDEPSGLGLGESAVHAAAVEAVVRADRERSPGPPGAGTGGGADTAPAPAGTAGSGLASDWWLVAVAVVGAVAVGYVLLVWVAPRLARRRRRSARSPRGQVVGAWQSVIDSLAVAGNVVPTGASPTEVVALGSSVGGPVAATALRPLAELAATALFAPDDVFDFEGGAGPAASAEAWRLADAFNRAVFETVAWRRRAVRRWSPRGVLAELRR